MGIVHFTFFQESTTNAVTSVVAQEGVVRKTQFPRLVIPLSTVVTGLFNLGLNLIIVFVFVLAFGVDPTWTWLLFPFARARPLRLHRRHQHGALGSLRPLPRRRDHLDGRRPGALLRDADPLSGRLKPKSRRYEHLLMINPLAVIFEQVRVWVLDTGRADRCRRPPAAGWACSPAASIFVCVCVFGVWIFNREAPRIAEDL